MVPAMIFGAAALIFGLLTVVFSIDAVRDLRARAQWRARERRRHAAADQRAGSLLDLRANLDHPARDREHVPGPSRRLVSIGGGRSGGQDDAQGPAAVGLLRDDAAELPRPVAWQAEAPCPTAGFNVALAVLMAGLTLAVGFFAVRLSDPTRAKVFDLPLVDVPGISVHR